MQLHDKTVLITGGSRGLGRALGVALAGAGARVVLVAQKPGPLATAVAAARAAGAHSGGQAHGIVADVGNKDAAWSIAGQAAALAGPIDVLINNASVLGPVPLRPLVDTDCEDFERALAVNLLGAFRLSKAVLGPMLLRGQGVVVDVSSDAAVEAYPTWGAYGASKAALDHTNRIWARELGGSGVRMFSVDPGEMDTELQAAAAPGGDRRSLADPADVAARIVALLRDPAAAPSGARVVARGAPLPVPARPAPRPEVAS